MTHDGGFESPLLLRKKKKRSLRCRCCFSDRFIWTAARGAQLDARSRHGRGAAEVDRSADPSSFGYRGKHRHHPDTPPSLPPPLFFLFFCQSPSHDSLPGGKESGRGKRGHTRIYCTVPGVQDAADNMRWIGCSKLEIVLFFFTTFKLKPGLPQLVHTPPRSGRSIAR